MTGRTPSSRKTPLAEALALPPSRTAWRMLTEVLDVFAPEELAAREDELEQRLSSWPPHVRTVPGRWLASVLDGSVD